MSGFRVSGVSVSGFGCQGVGFRVPGFNVGLLILRIGFCGTCGQMSEASTA